MQNIHSHALNQTLHLSPETVRECDLSRGFPLDLTVEPNTFLQDSEPFSKVAVFGMKARLTGWWVPDDFIADFVKAAPEKLTGFASCDPTQPGYLDELRHARETLGLRGLKMAPMYAGFDPRDPRCQPVYAYCQENGLPILFHTGTTFCRVAPLGFSRPWLWDEIAVQYPELRMVLAHVGHPWSDECLAVIRKHPHVYADTSALYYRSWQFYNTLILAQEYRVTHKVLFGTDYPFAAAGASIAGLREINRITGTSGLPEVTAETIEGILARDAFALLGLS